MNKILYFFKKKKQDILLLSILFVLIFLVYNGWFGPGIIAKGDLRSWSDTALKEFVSVPSSWEIYEGGGYYALSGMKVVHFPFWLFQGLISTIFNVGFAVVERLTLFYPFLVLSVFGMYSLSWYVFKNRAISFFSTLAYLLSPTMLAFAYVSHFSTMLLANSFSPWIILFCLKIFEQDHLMKVLKYGILTGAMVSLALYADIKIAYALFGVVLALFCYYAITDLFVGKLHKKQQILFKFIAFFSMICVLVLLNLFWILPMQLAPTLVGITESVIAFFNLDIVDQSFSLFSAFIGDPSRFAVSVISLSLITIVIVFAFVFSRNLDVRRKRIVLFLGLWFLVAAFLRKEGAEPFPELFVWMFKNVPGFLAFRDTVKLSFVSVLPWALLFGFSVFSIGNVFIKKIALDDVKRLVRGVFYSSIIFVFLSSLTWLLDNYPLASIDNNIKYFSTFEPENVSVENRQMENFFDADDDKFRILYLPTDPAYGILNENHTAIYTADLDTANLAFSRYFLSWRAKVKGILFQDKINTLGKILSLKNIKYVVHLPLSDIYYKSVGSETEKAKALSLLPLIEKQIDLKETNLGQNLNVFLNGNFERDKAVFLTSNSYLINGGLSSLLPLSNSSVNFNNSVFFALEYLRNSVFERGIGIENFINFEGNEDDLVLNTLPKNYFVDFWEYAEDMQLHGDEDKQLFFKEYGKYPTLANTHGEVILGPHGLVKSKNGFLGVLFDTEDAGQYEFWVRLGVVNNSDITKDVERDNLNSLIWFKVNDQTVPFEPFKLKHSNNLEWVKLFTQDLSPQQNKLLIYYGGDGKSLVLDQLVVVPVDKIAEHRQVVDNFLSKKNGLDIVKNNENPKFNYALSSVDSDVDQVQDIESPNVILTEISPTRYYLEFTVQKPSYLVFRDNYSPYWELTLNDKKYQSIATMDENNSYYIDKSGTYVGFLNFKPQIYMDVGFWMTIVGWVLFILYIFLFDLILKWYEK